MTNEDFAIGCMMEKPTVTKDKYIFFVKSDAWRDQFLAHGFRSVTIGTDLTVEGLDHAITERAFLKPGNHLDEMVLVPVLGKADTEALAVLADQIGARCETDLWEKFYRKEYLANGSHGGELEKILTEYIDTHEGVDTYAEDMDLDLHNILQFSRKSAEWIAPGIPKGGITLLCAEGGVGKSTFVTGLLADLSVGRPTLLDNVPQDPDMVIERKPRRCLFFSSEDSIEITAGRRFDAANADERNIFSLSASDPRFEKLKFRSDFLEKLVEKYRPDVVVFDPLQGFIDSTAKMSERNGMRSQLAPLLSMGEKYGTAFIILCHANKRDKAAGRSRVADSSDIWDAARSVFLLGFADEERELRYISHEKSNYSRPIRSVIFSIRNGRTEFVRTTVQRDVDFVKGEGAASGGSSPKSQTAQNRIREIMTEFGRRVSDLRSDHDFLQSINYSNILAGLPDEDVVMTSQELEARATAAGDSASTHRRAKKVMQDDGVLYYKACGYMTEKTFFTILRMAKEDTPLMGV